MCLTKLGDKIIKPMFLERTLDKTKAEYLLFILIIN